MHKLVRRAHELCGTSWKKASYQCSLHSLPVKCQKSPKGSRVPFPLLTYKALNDQKLFIKMPLVLFCQTPKCLRTIFVQPSFSLSTCTYTHWWKLGIFYWRGIQEVLLKCCWDAANKKWDTRIGWTWCFPNAGFHVNLFWTVFLIYCIHHNLKNIN